MFLTTCTGTASCKSRSVLLLRSRFSRTPSERTSRKWCCTTASRCRWWPSLGWPILCAWFPSWCACTTSAIAGWRYKVIPMQRCMLFFYSVLYPLLLPCSLFCSCILLICDLSCSCILVINPVFFLLFNRVLLFFSFITFFYPVVLSCCFILFFYLVFYLVLLYRFFMPLPWD